MKKLIAGLLMALGSAALSLSAMAEPVVAEGIEDAKAVVAVKCVKACLIMDEEDVAVLSLQIQTEMEKAYKAGLAGWSKEAALGGE